MTEVTIDNPDRVVTKRVDSSGRVYLGTNLCGEEVQVVVVREPETDSDDDDDETRGGK